MTYDFHYYGDTNLETLFPFLSGFLVLALIGGVIGWIIRVGLYVVRAIALNTIARRRGLNRPWLSWVPVGQEWIIGSLSDQYQYLTKGKNQSRRKILLALQLAAVIIGAVSLGARVDRLMDQLALIERNINGAHAAEVLGAFAGFAVIGALSSLVGIAAYVFRQMSMYDVYRSSNPKNAVLFLVLGILFGITEPFFLIYIRNRDEGMPPRRVVTPEPEL